MRLLTGKHRHQYEALLASEAHHRTLSEHLALQITRLTEDLTRERHRADNAVDELLASKGMAPVSPPPSLSAAVEMDPFAVDPEEQDRWRKVVQDHGLVAAMEEAANA